MARWPQVIDIKMPRRGWGAPPGLGSVESEGAN